MPSVRELTALYGNQLVQPRPGAGVCRTCLNLTDGYTRCYACAHTEQHLSVVAPISYSVAHEQHHRMLAGYKRLTGDVAARLQLGLAAILWRFLTQHERCVAQAVGSARFDIVATVPSSNATRDESHPLRDVVSRLCGPTRERHERLLMAAAPDADPRQFDPGRYRPTRELRGEAVLLVDDTWTTGASAQSAAAALTGAGAGCVAAVVIGRHVNREWGENDRRLRRLAAAGFDWDTCALVGPAGAQG